ncbi:hypothetical protein FRC00_006996 [Tulasnella sp. 408]|nr:hypothetical protein FRC00_006996 [Tulasnella sp. 408]
MAKLGATFGKPNDTVIPPTLPTNATTARSQRSQALQSTTVDPRSTTAFGMPLVHSPLTLEGK